MYDGRIPGFVVSICLVLVSKIANDESEHPRARRSPLGEKLQEITAAFNVIAKESNF